LMSSVGIGGVRGRKYGSWVVPLDGLTKCRNSHTMDEVKHQYK